MYEKKVSLFLHILWMRLWSILYKLNFAKILRPGYLCSSRRRFHLQCRLLWNWIWGLKWDTRAVSKQKSYNLFHHSSFVVERINKIFFRGRCDKDQKYIFYDDDEVWSGVNYMVGYLFTFLSSENLVLELDIGEMMRVATVFGLVYVA